MFWVTENQRRAIDAARWKRVQSCSGARVSSTLAAGRGGRRRAGRGRRSSGGSWCGTRSAVAGFGLGVFCRRSIGTCSRSFARTLCFLGTAFTGVVVHIPACTLKTQRGSSHRPNQDSLAFGAFTLRLGAETLDLFKAVAARGAAVFVEWQARSSNKVCSLSILVFSSKFRANEASRKILKNSSCALTHSMCYRL
jgi:hypothetical protein